MRNKLVLMAIPLLALSAACGGDEPEAAPEAVDGAAAPAETAPAPAAQPGAGAPAGPLPAGATAEMVQQGQQIFTSNGICFTCHGPDAKGGALAPNLTDNQWLWFDQQPTLDEVTTLIKTGVSQPKEHPAPMPAMGGAQLSDEQVRAVAAYVLSISGGGAAS